MATKQWAGLNDAGRATDGDWQTGSVPPTPPTDADTAALGTADCGPVAGDGVAGSLQASGTCALDDYDFLITSDLACFRAGTAVATPAGACLVERLVVGDTVLTESGGVQPVRWIGRRHVDFTRHPSPDRVFPVRIAAGAFGPGRPHRPLYLSPDHAVFLEGVLIPVKYLHNGTTVRRVRVQSATYYHVELPRHDVLLAEGLPAESYLDTGDRAGFANAGAVVTLHPEWGDARRDAAGRFDACGAAPLRVTGPEVARARAVLSENARRTSQRNHAGRLAPK